MKLEQYLSGQMEAGSVDFNVKVIVSGEGMKVLFHPAYQDSGAMIFQVQDEKVAQDLEETVMQYPEPRFDNLGFEEALAFVKATGCRAARAGWNGKGQYIEIATGISYMNTNGEIINAEHASIGNRAIAFVGTSGVQLGWLASQADLLANDWMILIEECPAEEERVFEAPSDPSIEACVPDAATEELPVPEPIVEDACACECHEEIESEAEPQPTGYTFTTPTQETKTVEMVDGVPYIKEG